MICYSFKWVKNNIQLVFEYGFDIEGNQVEKGKGRTTVMFL